MAFWLPASVIDSNSTRRSQFRRLCDYESSQLRKPPTADTHHSSQVALNALGTHNGDREHRMGWH
jgi:hypothetical protein